MASQITHRLWYNATRYQILPRVATCLEQKPIFGVHHNAFTCRQLHANFARPPKRRMPRFRVLSDSSSEVVTNEFKQNQKSSEAKIAQYKEILAVATAGGGKKGIQKHTQVNKKLFLDDKLKLLLDEGEEFLELSPLSGMGMEYGSVPRATLLSGIGKVNGTYCMVSANDGSVKGGTIFPISNKKSHRFFEICQENRLPMIMLVDSGGAFLPLQADIFPGKEHGGRVFYNEAINNSMNIAQLAIVCGSCTAGGAYLPTMCQENIIVDKLGTMFLGGPPLVYAATGEISSGEDLGGATLHTSVSGCLDHFAEDEVDAYEQARNIVSTFNIPEIFPCEDYEEPLYDPQEILGLIPDRDQHTMDMYKVLARLLDGSRFQEFKAKYGTTLITGFAHIKGHLIGVVANHQGPITEDAASKGAHFIGLCDQRDVPVVFLQNTTPEPYSVQSVDEAEVFGTRLRGHARLMSAVACAQVPKITIIAGNSFGAENYLMGGRSFSPRFLFSWPNAQLGLQDPRSLVHALVQSSSADPDSAEYKSALDEARKSVYRTTSAMHASAHIWDDGIVLPQETRNVIAKCLNIISQSEVVPRNETMSPVIRL